MLPFSYCSLLPSPAGKRRLIQLPYQMVKPLSYTTIRPGPIPIISQSSSPKSLQTRQGQTAQIIPEPIIILEAKAVAAVNQVTHPPAGLLPKKAAPASVRYPGEEDAGNIKSSKSLDRKRLLPEPIFRQQPCIVRATL